jgi:hypothetical protein
MKLLLSGAPSGPIIIEDSRRASYARRFPGGSSGLLPDLYSPSNALTLFQADLERDRLAGVRDCAGSPHTA